MPSKDIQVKENEVCVVMTDRAVVYNQSQEIKNAVFNRLIDWYFKHQRFSGEGIMQSDDPLIDAPVILSEIADEIIKFNVRWDE